MPLLILVGFAAGAIGVVWFAIDSARIPSMIWYWSGYSRPGWWGAMALCLLAFGYPAVTAAIAWRFSEARKALRLEYLDVRQEGRAAREARIGRSGSSVA